MSVPGAKPLPTSIKQLRGTLRMMLSEFGMSPASRSRVHAQPLDDEDDPFAQFEHQRGVARRMMQNWKAARPRHSNRTTPQTLCLSLDATAISLRNTVPFGTRVS
jgi:hypothetical protein